MADTHAEEPQRDPTGRVNRRSMITRGGAVAVGLAGLTVATSTPAHALSGTSPTGPAGGSLTGSYPNPGIAQSTIGDSHIDNTDPIGRDKLLAPETPRLVGAVGEPAFETGWSNFGSGARPLQFWYDAASRLVHVEGTVASTGADVHVFTLPTGYAPPPTENVGGVAKELGGSTMLDWAVVSGGAFIVTPATTLSAVMLTCSFRVD